MKETEIYPFVPPPPTGWMEEMISETGYAEATIRRAIRGWRGNRGDQELHQPNSSVAVKIRRVYTEKYVLPYLKGWNISKTITL